MTNINTHWNYNKPFLLKPIGKDYIWGGRRLNDDFSKGINMNPLAETWECSTHPNGVNLINSGEFVGLSLQEVINRHPEYLGKHNEQFGTLPILVKLIDAKQNLSIQVHPDDHYAFINEDGQKGKTEFWYIIDSNRDSFIYYGLHHGASREVVEKSIFDNNLELFLRKIPVKSDEVYFIKAGTIHAIGAGTLVAEIQQNSDLTYRLFDYNRIDKNGKRRELQIEKALDVANLGGMDNPDQPLRLLKYSPGCAIELLGRCKYYQVERMLVNTERIRNMVSIKTDDLSYEVLLCINGCGVFTFADSLIPFFKGDCMFIPANSDIIKIHGKASFLLIRS